MGSWITSVGNITGAGEIRSTSIRRGPEVEDAIDEALASHPDNGDVLAAVVLEATAKSCGRTCQRDVIEVTGDGLSRCSLA